MTPDRAIQILKELRERAAKARRGREYFNLLRKRDDVTEAFEAEIHKMGSGDLFKNHEVIRREDGTWVWINTKRKQKPAPDSTSNGGAGR